MPTGEKEQRTTDDTDRRGAVRVRAGNDRVAFIN